MPRAPQYRIVQHPDGWTQVDPLPSPEALAAFYAGEYYQGSHGVYEQRYSDQELAHRQLLSRALIHALGDAGAKGGALLEIGCGEGFFLKAARDAGYDIQGLEFSDHGLKSQHPELLDDVRFGDAFAALDQMIAEASAVDVCVMEHVLEHVLDPEGLLARLPRLLNPGGLIAITVPNDFSLVQVEARDLGLIDRDFWVNPPQHLNYFNGDNLPRLLNRMGFEVVSGFASFPIDWFLHHPGSNYVADPEAGKPAHHARMVLDQLLARNGLDEFLAFGRALFACGAGRSITVTARTR